MKRGRYFKSNNNKSFVVRVNQEDYEKLKIIAESYNLSINSIMCNAIKNITQTCEIPYIDKELKKRAKDALDFKTHGIDVIKIDEEKIIDDLEL